MNQLVRREIAAGERFMFGQNWSNFLSVLDHRRIEVTVRSLRNFLGVDSLSRHTLLTLGPGRYDLN